MDISLDITDDVPSVEFVATKSRPTPKRQPRKATPKVSEVVVAKVESVVIPLPRASSASTKTKLSGRKAFATDECEIHGKSESGLPCAKFSHMDPRGRGTNQPSILWSIRQVIFAPVKPLAIIGGGFLALFLVVKFFVGTMHFHGLVPSTTNGGVPNSVRPTPSNSVPSTSNVRPGVYIFRNSGAHAVSEYVDDTPSPTPTVTVTATTTTTATATVTDTPSQPAVDTSQNDTVAFGDWNTDGITEMASGILAVSAIGVGVMLTAIMSRKVAGPDGSDVDNE